MYNLKEFILILIGIISIVFVCLSIIILRCVFEVDFFRFFKLMFYPMVFEFKKILINKNFIFINKNDNLGILKTKKSKKEIQLEFDKLNIPDFDFNDYFIFVEKNKIKKLKKEKLLKQFEQNIQNEISQLGEFETLKLEIKETIEKQEFEMKNKMINDILLENDFDNSFNDNINLENSIKEIKN